MEGPSDVNYMQIYPISLEISTGNAYFASELQGLRPRKLKKTNIWAPEKKHYPGKLKKTNIFTPPERQSGITVYLPGISIRYLPGISIRYLPRA